MGLNDFYKFIQARVCELNDVKYFDLWDEQPFAEGRPIYDCPAVFFEWEDSMEMNSIGNLKQDADVVFTLHLETEAKGNTDNLGDANERTDGLEHLHIADLIFAKLHGHNGIAAQLPIGTIKRTTIVSINLGETRLTSQIFSCKATFDAAARKYQTVSKPTLNNSYPAKL